MWHHAPAPFPSLPQAPVGLRCKLPSVAPQRHPNPLPTPPHALSPGFSSRPPHTCQPGTTRHPAPHTPFQCPPAAPQSPPPPATQPAAPPLAPHPTAAATWRPAGWVVWLVVGGWGGRVGGGVGWDNAKANTADIAGTVHCCCLVDSTVARAACSMANVRYGTVRRRGKQMQRVPGATPGKCGAA